jgi:hypothetical protein
MHLGSPISTGCELGIRYVASGRNKRLVPYHRFHEGHGQPRTEASSLRRASSIRVGHTLTAHHSPVRSRLFPLRSTCLLLGRGTVQHRFIRGEGEERSGPRPRARRRRRRGRVVGSASGAPATATCQQRLRAMLPLLPGAWRTGERTWWSITKVHMISDPARSMISDPTYSKQILQNNSQQIVSNS